MESTINSTQLRNRIRIASITRLKEAARRQRLDKMTVDALNGRSVLFDDLED